MTKLAQRATVWTICLLMLTACVGVPDGVQPVGEFEADRYLGTWYEIARLDHSFERGLTDVSAQYAKRAGGGIEVINRGYSTDDRAWDEARGKAFFVESPDIAFLKVSFFGPFYGSYIVFELDADYQYAFVCGPNRDYLWLLARSPVVPAALIDRFRDTATALGFDLSEMVLVDQRRNSAIMDSNPSPR